MKRFDANAVAGVVGIGLLLVALFLPGPPPKSSDTVADLTQVLIDKRSVLLVGTWIAGLGGAAFLWFLGSAQVFLRRDADAEVEATAATAGGVAAVLLMWCGIAVSSALSLGVARSGDGSLIRAGVDLGNILIELSKFGIAVFVAATCVGARRSAALGQRMTAAGLVAAAVVVVSALPPFVADHGFWQFGGPPEIAGGLPAALWVVWLSVHLARRVGGHVQLQPS
jgi:hypothetical protein